MTDVEVGKVIKACFKLPQKRIKKKETNYKEQKKKKKDQ